MGRNYYGEITGNFWVGVQDSNDAENFGVESIYGTHYCYTCGCEDWEENGSEDEYEGECEECNCPFECEEQEDENLLDFYFEEENVDDIQKVLDEIKVILPDIPIPIFLEDDEDPIDLSETQCSGNFWLM